jgi:hypothetical protein
VLAPLALGACRVDIAPYDDRGCNAQSPCREGSGRVCVRERCELPWDGGVYPVPDPTTTGPFAGAVLMHSGPLQVNEAGKVLDGLDVAGCVTVTADGVTLRNLRIHTDGKCLGDPLLDLRGAKGTVVEDVELDGTGHGQVYALMGADMTLRRVHVHDAWTGIRLSGDHVHLEHSLIHQLTSTSAGAFVSSGGTDLQLIHDVLEVAQGDCVVTLYSQDSAIEDVLAQANLINGGGWSVSAGGGNAALPTSNVRFLGNRFGKKFFPRCGVYGPLENFEAGNPGNVWEANVWDDTSQPLSP